MPAAIIAGVGLAVAAVGTVATISSQNKQRELAEQQYGLQKQSQQNSDIRARRDAIRAARMSQGQLEQGAATAGVSESSAAQGGLASLDSQLDSNLSFLDTQANLRDQIGQTATDAKVAAINTSNAAAVTSLGFAVFNDSDGISKKVFGK